MTFETLHRHILWVKFLHIYNFVYELPPIRSKPSFENQRSRLFREKYEYTVITRTNKSPKDLFTSTNCPDFFGKVTV
jgi:hypothetical protein